MLHFDLNEQMVVAIARLLGNSPYNEVAPILAELQKQIDAQKEAASVKEKRRKKTPALNGGQNARREVHEKSEHAQKA